MKPLIEAVAEAIWKERQCYAKEVLSMDLEDYATRWGDFKHIADANNIYGEAQAALDIIMQSPEIEALREKAWKYDDLCK